jgi:RND family efflux transporter MFP subunit
MKRQILCVVMSGGALAGSLTLVACTRRVEGSAPPADQPAVAVVRVERGTISQALKVAAEFRPYQQIEVHAKVAGYVKRINVDVGDRVRAGQLLAVLEVPELEDEMRQDEAGVKRAEEEVNRAQSEVGRSQSAYEVAHMGADRLSGVLKVRPNLVAQQDVDEAVGRDRVAAAQVETAKAALASAREQLDIAKAAQNKTKTLFAYAQITAPFDGVITRRYADTGAMIQAGTSSQTQAMPLVTLSDNARLRLVIPVPESVVSRIRVGRPVDLHVQALGKTFSGTVARFADRLDTDTRTMRVEVDVPNPTFELVPGMYADASIVLDEAKDVVVVPVEAIDRSGSTGRVVVVGSDNRVQPRDVRLGLDSGDRLQVTAGLDPGDLIVVGNRSQLSAGAVVTPRLMPTQTAERSR